jgi:hypothetical protein
MIEKKPGLFQPGASYSFRDKAVLKSRAANPSCPSPAKAANIAISTWLTPRAPVFACCFNFRDALDIRLLLFYLPQPAAKGFMGIPFDKVS